MPKEFVTVTQIEAVHVIDLWLPEQLDSEAFTQLNESMMRTLDGKIDGRWLLDLASVQYMGSSVLGLMINIRQHIKSGGGKLALSGLTPRLSQIFRTCCLEKLFVISRNREEGLRALGK